MRTSLLECSLPAIGGDRPDELIEVNVHIPHAYEVGDNLHLTYQCCGTPQEVENKVCLDLLCFLLVSSPHKVMLHPNTMRHGDQSISTIRETAEQVQHEYLQRCQQIPCQPLAAWVAHPLPRRPQPTSIRVVVPGKIEFTLQEKLAAFDHLTPGVVYHFEQAKVQGRRKLPPVCRQELSVKLEKGGLLSFLQQFPHIFEVVLTGEKTAKNKPKYVFSFLVAQPSLHANAEPAIGGTAAAPAKAPPPKAPPPPPTRPLPSEIPPPPNRPPLGASGASSSSTSGAAIGGLMMPPGASGASSSSASGPAIGGLMMPPGLAISAAAPWSVDDVVTYATSLELGHLEGIVRREGIDGHTLRSMTSARQDLREAGMTNVQAKKLLARLAMPGSESWQ